VEDGTSTAGMSHPHRALAAERWTPRFFAGMALIMLLLNLVGFAPTYFFKTVFDSPALPLRTHIHGVLFSSWFVLFAVQTTLVTQRRIELHRRLGFAGMVVAAGMVISGLIILYFRALEYDGTAESLSATTTLVWGNLGLLALFAGFVLLGFMERRTPFMHRHLMLFAGIAMMGQSLGRLGRFPGFRLGDSLLLNEVLYGLGGLTLLVAAVCFYDLSTRRRLHPVTLFGGPTILGVIVLAAAILPGTELAQSLVLWLNG